MTHRSRLFPGMRFIHGLVVLLLSGVVVLTGASPVPAAASGDAVLQPSMLLAAPPPPVGLSCTEMPDKSLYLTWERSGGASQYRLYRSLIQGTYVPGDPIFTYNVTSPYTPLGYPDISFDPGLHTYYYVVTAVNADGEESVFSNEVSGLPHYRIEWTGTILPGDFTYTLGDPALRTLISGEIYIIDHTGEFGPEPDVWAQFGYGPAGADPANETVDLTQWVNWQDAYYGGWGAEEDANSRYMVDFMPEKIGRYYYTYRFSTTGGRDWVYPNYHSTVLDPTRVIGSMLRLMTINGNPDDSQPPVPPVLGIESITETTVSLDWSESTSQDIYAYDLYRSTDPAVLGQLVSGGRRLAGEASEFTDVGLVSGTHYYYRVVALDTSFNAAQSNQVDARTLNSPVTFTLHVSIPAVTPGPVYINRDYDAEADQFGARNWTGIPLSCNYATRFCSVVLTIQENSWLSFNFSRGSVDTIQTQFNGNSPAIDPSFQVVKGMTVVNRSIANWDDPLVTKYAPQGDEISPYTRISVTWNQDMPPDTTFAVKAMGADGLGPAVDQPGHFQYDPDTHTLTFIPAMVLKASWYYQVDVKDQPDLKEPPVLQQVETVWTFQTSNFFVHFPSVRR